MIDGKAITIANDSTISSMIASATRRVVVLAPGVSMSIAESIVAKWNALGGESVSVVLDVDPEVYRLGYGEFKALELLEATAAKAGTLLNRQPGIRVGLVIVDDETLVYSPTPLLIEAGPKRPETPNAIRLGAPPANVERELGQGPKGVLEQKIGLDKADKAAIQAVDNQLKKNPPQKFDVSRSVRVFNAAFEFVDLELLGTFIDRKTVSIPKHLSGIKDSRTREQLRTSYTILPSGHKLSGEHLQKDRKLIDKRFLRTIPGYGMVVLRSQKAAFESGVEQLRKDVAKFADKIRDELQSAMDKQRESLVKAMLPTVKRTPPQDWSKSDGTKPDAETVEQFLNDDLRKAFGTAETLIKEMKVKLIFKGVTFELLSDGKFREAAREALPELKELHDEFDAAKATNVPGTELVRKEADNG